MPKHILPSPYFYLNLTEINRLGMPDPTIMHKTVFILQQELLSLIIIVPLFCMVKLQ